jgi:hypothetical protein
VLTLPLPCRKAHKQCWIFHLQPACAAEMTKLASST